MGEKGVGTDKETNISDTRSLRLGNAKEPPVSKVRPCSTENISWAGMEEARDKIALK